MLQKLKLVYALFSFSILLYSINSIINLHSHQPSSIFDNNNHNKDHHPRNRVLQTSSNTGEYVVEWSLSLGSKEFLLESPFLKAGLELSIKEYINMDIECNNLIEIGNAAFYSVEIMDVGEGKQWRNGRIEGNGKCKGLPERCLKSLEESQINVNSTEDDDDFFREDDDKEEGDNDHSDEDFDVNDDANDDANDDQNNIVDFVGDDDDDDSKDTRKKKHFSMISSAMGSTVSKMHVCEIFKGSTIFDIFEKILVTASSFNYHVDVEVINDLSGILSLNYNVTFQPASSNGLSQIENIALDARESRAVSTHCLESQCITQRSIIRNIFNHFGINFDESKHECLHKGVNCNSDDLVIHIWIGKC